MSYPIRTKEGFQGVGSTAAVSCGMFCPKEYRQVINNNMLEIYFNVVGNSSVKKIVVDGHRVKIVRHDLYVEVME